MGMYLIFLVYSIPCILFLLYCLPPRGRHWLKNNGMI